MEKNYKYLIIDIKNMEPIKIGTNGVRNQVETSKTYIPGSTIKGAVISKLIYTKKVDSNLMGIDDNEINKKEILTNLCFYNAYPYINSNDDNEYKLCIKNPICLRTNKHEYREARNEDNSSFEKFINLLDEKDGDKEKTLDMRNNIPLDYIRLDDNKITNYVVEKELRFHHNKRKADKLRKDKKNDKTVIDEVNNIFRYEAIKKNNQFCGIIKGNEKLLNIIKNIIIEDNIMYLGGSKGSGYGRCCVKDCTIVDSYEQVKENLHIDYKINSIDRLQLNCVSDCILRDEKGNPINYILPSEINGIVGNNLIDEKEEVRVIADVSYSQGYNVKWGLRYPKEPCLQAGSVIEYKCNRNVTDEDILNIEKTLYGVRITDGYGWIMANVKIPSRMDVKENNIQDNIYIKEDKDKQEELIKRLEEDKTFNLIIKNLNHARNTWIEILARREKENIKCNISNTLIEKIKEKIKEDIKEDTKKIKKENIDTIFFDNQLKVMKNKDKYSIYGESLYNLISYSNLNQDSSKFISDKLNTTKGKLLYNKDKGKFIKEFILKTFEICGGANNE